MLRHRLALRGGGREIPIVLITAHLDIAARLDADAFGDVVVKLPDAAEMTALLRQRLALPA